MSPPVAPPRPPASTAPPPRATVWRVLDGLLKVLLPLTWLGSLLFLPEWLVQRLAEGKLRRGARLEQGVGGMMTSDALELLRANQPALVIPFAGIKRVHWMVLPKNAQHPDGLYVVRIEDHKGNAWLVEEPPPGFTRQLSSRGLVSRLAYLKPVEWAVLAAWWAVVGAAAYAWVPWAELERAWREANAPVTRPGT